MKAATYAQERDNGATSRGRVSEISYNEESVVVEVGCFNINLNRASHG